MMQNMRVLKLHSVLLIALCLLSTGGLFSLHAQAVTGGSKTAQPRLADRVIDSGSTVTLPNHVRKDLSVAKSVGLVEDSTPIGLTLVLKRTAQQDADLDGLIARQQQPGSADYHKWLTPQQFGERFGVAESDIRKITIWLESQGFEVKSVLNNASMITFQATAGGVRNTFGTQLHHISAAGGKYPVNLTNPKIPSALANLVSGIAGLSKIPTPSEHTAAHPVEFSAQTHQWMPSASLGATADVGKVGEYDVTPQDFYTIYNVMPVFNAGNAGAKAVIALPEPTDIPFGTVDAEGRASGGVVQTFRDKLGVPGTLNMVVMHGAGTVACDAPGVTANHSEATIDSEWSNATAPSAKMIFMSCDARWANDGFSTALMALIDNNLGDVISANYGFRESEISSAEIAQEDSLLKQAATQGQSFIGAAGYRRGVDQFAGHPLVTGVGGNDFADKYEADLGGSPQENYWGANDRFFGNAKSYIPEMSANGTCVGSLFAADCHAPGLPVVKASDQRGFSATYSRPSYQTGMPGLKDLAIKRVVPDVSLFAGGGASAHSLIYCDSSSAAINCSSPSKFAAAGGTSFSGAQFAGVAGLLVTHTGGRLGNMNPQLYALDNAEVRRSSTGECVSSQGGTSGRTGSGCVFNKVTSNGSEGKLDVSSGSSSISAGRAAGLGSVNVANLVAAWGSSGAHAPDSLLASTIAFTANPTLVHTGQSTTLTAKITTTAGGKNPTPTGSVSFEGGFLDGAECTLDSTGACSFVVDASQLFPGANVLEAEYLGDNNYGPAPAAQTTVDNGIPNTTALTASPSAITTAQSTTLTATITVPKGGAAPTGSVSFYYPGASTTSLGTCTLTGNTCSVSALGSLFPQLGPNTAIALYAGDGNYASSTSPGVTVTVTGAGASPTATTLTAVPSTITQVQSTLLSASVAVVGSSKRRQESATPTGTVTFLLGSTSLGSCDLSAPPCAVDLYAGAFALGPNSVTASYGGDSNFNPSTSPAVIVTVTALAKTPTSLTVSVNPPSITASQSTTVTVFINELTGNARRQVQVGPTGTVTFSVPAGTLGTCTPSSNACSLTIAGTSLVSGLNTITATYGGDSNYSGSNGTGTVTVTAAAKTSTSTALGANPTAITTAQSTTLTATVSALQNPAVVKSAAATPTGTVTFSTSSKTLGTCSLSAGACSLSVAGSALALGSNSITATYGGDSNYSGSTSTAATVTVTAVAKGSTRTGVSANPTSVTVENSTTLTATVGAVQSGVKGEAASGPSGTVTFTEGSTNLGSCTLVSGSCTVSVPGSSLSTVGANTITATYGGDANYTGSSGTTSVTLLNLSEGTSTALGANPTAITTAQSTTLTATVSAVQARVRGRQATPNPTGTVTFSTASATLGTCTINSSTGICTISLAGTALAIGSNSITATYGGDTNYGGSTSPVATVTVTAAGKTSSSTALGANPTAITTAQSTTLTAMVSALQNPVVVKSAAAAPTGTVTFSTSSKTLGTCSLSSGACSISVAGSALALGSNSITATYGGDANYSGSTSTAATVTVTAVGKTSSSTALGANPTAITTAQSTTLTAAVSGVQADLKGKAAAAGPTGTVTFRTSSKTLGTCSLSSGACSISVAGSALALGSNSITATYGGDANYNGSTSTSATVTVTAASATPTSTALVANPASITTAQSSSVTATVQAVMSNVLGRQVVLHPTGTVTFRDASSIVGTCTLSTGTCTVSVAGSALALGTNPITGTYSGDSTYAASVSSSITVTVAGVPSGCLPTSTGVLICSPTPGIDNPSTSPVTITAGALSKDAYIKTMRAYINNVLVATVSNPGWTHSFQFTQTVGANVGSHRLVVVAYLSTGGVLVSHETFWVAGPPTDCPPSTTGAMICSPGPNATVSSPIQLNAGATVLTGGHITSIKVYVDNLPKLDVQNPQQSTSFAINQSLTIPPGTHKLVIVGYGSKGNVVTAADEITVEASPNP